ncbi:hypothetical protein Plhal703r1_c03g0016611 [Plasmopara halstedii]
MQSKSYSVLGFSRIRINSTEAIWVLCYLNAARDCGSPITTALAKCTSQLRHRLGSKIDDKRLVSGTTVLIGGASGILKSKY